MLKIHNIVTTQLSSTQLATPLLPHEDQLDYPALNVEDPRGHGRMARGRFASVLAACSAELLAAILLQGSLLSWLLSLQSIW